MQHNDSISGEHGVEELEHRSHLPVIIPVGRIGKDQIVSTDVGTQEPTDILLEDASTEVDPLDVLPEDLGGHATGFNEHSI